MPKSKTLRSTAKKLVARTVAGGAQQYVRGKDAYERLITAGKAEKSTKNPAARQMLLEAKKSAMSPEARANFAQYKEDTKRYDLSRGTALASRLAKISAKNAPAKSRKK